MSQYADDLIVFSRPELNSIKRVLQELNEFTNVSGLKTNFGKTKCLQIGENIATNDITEIGLTTVDELKVLGIQFGKCNENITANNLALILPKIVQEIGQWRRRNLTLIGKITVVKALLISKIVHVLSVLPNPSKQDTRKLNGLLFNFIWNNGPDKVKRSVLVQDYINGGLKMIDIHSFLLSLKASWLKRLSS